MVNGVIPVELRVDANSFDIRDMFDVPHLTGRAWLVDGSQTLQIDYEFESNPISFLHAHGWNPS